MRNRFMWLTAICLAASTLGAPAGAQQPDFVVGEVPFPQHKWGQQTIAFKVTNTTQALKFVTVETDIAFEGSYVNPRRVIRNNFVVPPESTAELSPSLEIPSNYGNMTLQIKIYDVVDTLDDISLGKEFYEQPFKIKFTAPDGMLPYLQEKMTLPPTVGYYGLFDSEFARILPILLQEKRSIATIADLAHTDTTFVRALAGEMVNRTFLKKAGGSYEPNISIITLEHAKEGRALADTVSDKLAKLIAGQLKDGRRVVDSLLRAGSISKDSNNFFEGSSLVYRNYPLVTVVCMWREMGSRFVVGQGPLLVFRNTDPCNGDIGPFMYIVQGGDYYNGHEFYDATVAQNGLNMRFGDSIPEVDCHPNFERVARPRENVDWNYTEPFSPDSYLMDTTVTLPVARTILEGADPILKDAMESLRALSLKHNCPSFNAGQRYWFWDLTASLITDKLLATGAIARLGNGQFRIVSK